MATVEEGTIQVGGGSGGNRRKKGGGERGGQDQGHGQGQGQKNRREKKTDGEKSTNSPVANLPQVVHHDHPSSVIKEHISDDPEAEQCFICADAIRYSAYYPCGHVCCSKCALRLRALIGDKGCTLCRKEGETVIISSQQKEGGFDSFSKDELKYKDEKHGVVFDDRIVKDKVLNLLKLNCPVRGCTSEALSNWKELKKHVQAVHNKMLCDICTRHKASFTVELEYYTRQTLSRHERDGDDRGFKGHPQCEFCRLRFYSGDELFTHCREKHEKCFICERQLSSPPQYYRDYERLEKHFEDEHFVCQVQSCKDRKFVVFGTKVELQDHMISTHTDIVGKSRLARRVDVDVGFARSGGRGGNNNNFGSQLSTIPVGSGSGNAGGSGGASGSSGNGSNIAVPNRTTTPALDPDSFPTLSSTINYNSSNPRLPANVSSYHSNLPPSDNSQETLKKRLEERARTYLNYDTGKFLKFQELNTKYKDGHIDSKQIIFDYNKLFDVKISQLEILIQELAALYKNLPAKKGALLNAFEDWKAKQAYPTLGSHSLPGSRTNLSASWVSSSSNTNTSRTPGSIKTTLKSTEQFPSLITPKPKPVTHPSINNTTTTPTSASLIGATRVIPRSTTNTTKGKFSSDSFPSLPSANSTKPPPVRVRTPVSTPSVWHPSTSTSPPPPAPEDPPLSTAANSSRKKGKNKQVLLRLGAFES